MSLRAESLDGRVNFGGGSGSRSGRDAGLGDEVVDGLVVCAVGLAKGAVVGWGGVGEFGESGALDAVVDAGGEPCVALSGVGDGVAEGAGGAFDKPVCPESAQVVGHLSAGDGLDVEECGETGA